MEYVQSISASASAPASASSSLASQNFLVKIPGHALVLRRLLSSSSNNDKIITPTLIPISSLLRVSKSRLYLKKRCRHKHNFTILILRNDIFFGSVDDIEVLISPKLALYNCSHATVRLGHLILGDVILSL